MHWTPASVPAFAPVDVEIGELVAVGRTATRSQNVPYTEWYENSLRFPDSPVARHHREVYGNRPYAEFAAEWEAGLEQWDPDEWAARLRGDRRALRRARDQAHGRLLPVADRRTQPAPRRTGAARRDVVGELARGGARRGDALRRVLLRRARLRPSTTGRSARWPTSLDAVPRGDYPAYAEAQVRELIARYRPSVLWNDIAWPTEGKRLWPLFEHYYAQVPDGVVNDRWMPWSPLLAATRFAARAPRDRRGHAAPGPARRGTDPAEAAALRRAHARVRRVRRHPARAVGVRAGHGPELRVQRAVAARALPRARRAALDAHRHRRQGRQPAAQRRPARRRRADPRRAAHPPRLARATGSGRTPTRSWRRGRGWCPASRPPTASRSGTPHAATPCTRSCATRRARSRCPTCAPPPTTAVTTVGGAALAVEGHARRHRGRPAGRATGAGTGRGRRCSRSRQRRDAVVVLR